MMRIIPFLLLVFLALVCGCEQSAKERGRIEEARADFLAHQGQTGFDAASEKLDAGPHLEFPRLREFRDCTVGRSWIFEELSLSPEVEFWAVELEFTGTDVETRLKEKGRAVLLYRAFHQVGEESRLLGIFPGTTPEEIEMIEEGTSAAFEFLEAGD
jgi:hypothetical protein